MNEKWKWRTGKRLRRGAVLLGGVGLAAGLALSIGGVALAAGVGSQPGNLQLLLSGTVITPGATPGTGTAEPLTSIPTWQTTTACPTGFQGSAAITEYTTAGVAGSVISTVAPTVTTPFSGALDGSIGALLTTAPLNISGTNPGTAEFVVGCYTAAAAGGTVSNVQSIFVTVAAGSTNFTLSTAGPTLITPTVTVTNSPASAVTGTAETFTAAVAAGTAFPAGTVQFSVNGTALGTPVAVNTGNVSAPAVSSADTFTTAGTETIQAAFTPTATATYTTATGSESLLVTQSGSLPAAGSPVTLSLTIAASGTLSVSVSPSAETLTVNTAGTQATGSLGTVTVSDSRNTFPGWSVSGQETTAFAEASPGTGSIPSDDLGWAPAASGTLGAGVTIGPAITAGTSPGGLGDTGGVLISATPGNGFGSNAATAALTLNIPTGTPAGSYSGTFTVTYLSVGP